MIRIDCKMSRFSYIKKNIMNSKLCELFDFSLVDWTDCDIKSQKLILVSVCDYYNKHHCSITEISHVFGLSTHTISSYLVKGNKLGICSFKVYDTLKKPITAYCLSSGNFYDFQSIGEDTPLLFFYSIRRNKSMAFINKAYYNYRQNLVPILY